VAYKKGEKLPIVYCTVPRVFRSFRNDRHGNSWRLHKAVAYEVLKAPCVELFL